MPNPLLQALRELANHLGAKLDTLITKTPKIEIDLGESSKSLTEAAKSLDTVSKLIAQNEKGRDFSGVQSALIKVASDIQGVASSMSAVLRQVSSSESKSISTLGKLLTATMANKPKEVKVDLKPLEKQMKGVQEQLTQLEKAILRIDMEPYAKGMEMLAEAWKGLKFEFPSEFKLNEMQVKQMAYGGGGSGGTLSVSGGILAARRVDLQNVAMASANTEYSVTFPKNTVSWELRLRDTDVPLLCAYTTGKLPTSGDGSAYFTVPAYFIQHNTGLDWGGKVLYVQAATASQTLEVISYQA